MIVKEKKFVKAFTIFFRFIFIFYLLKGVSMV